jgi:hypothetical protein
MDLRGPPDLRDLPVRPDRKGRRAPPDLLVQPVHKV